MSDPRRAAIPDVHGHAKGEHRPYTEERPIAYSARMLFLWFYHACRRMSPRFLMVADHANYLTFEDPGAVNTVRRALKLAEAGDLLGAAETAGVDVAHASVVSDALRRGMRFSIGAEMDNDPRARPDAQNIIDALRPDGIVRCVRFIPITHPDKGADWAWPFANEEFAELYEVIGTERLWELYMAKLLEDIGRLPTQIVGGFYSPAMLGHWPAQKKLEEYEDRLLDVAHSRGLAIEISTRFLYRDYPEDRKKKYLEANARLIRKAKARGVGIAIGSNAHSPKDQGNAFEVVLKLLDDAKINEVVFPIAGRLARVALRATREHLEAHAQAGRQPAAPGSSITGFSRAELGLPEEIHLPGGRKESARATRVTAAKKRTSDATRAPKRAQVPPSVPRTSGRSAQSSAAATRAKAERTVKPAPTPKKKTSQAPSKKRLERPQAKKQKKAAAKPSPVRRKKTSPVRAAAKKKPAAKPAKKTVGRKSAGKTTTRKITARRPPKSKAKPLAASRSKKPVKRKKTAVKRR